MKTNVIEIEGLLFLGLGKHRHSMENCFLPSSDVKTHEGTQNFSPKELHF